MICSSSSPPIRRRPGEGRAPRGFTLVELLVVILILAVLIALLLPALNGALKTARNAAVGGEINQLAQALASFKTQYGDYPPSRIYLAEDGNFGQAASTQIAPGDITYAQLAQRSASILRKFFPRVVINTTNNVVWPHNQTNRWYDFNGNGSFDYATPYILQGHECLVFFLGGIVLSDSFPNPITVSSNLGMTGFGKDPTNPFSNNIANGPNYQNNPNPMYSNNRQAPFFEFAGSRLWLDPHGTSGMPGYLDSLGNATPTGNPGDPINFYAYFSSYGNGGYDPNDVNFFTELDVNHSSAKLIYHVAFPTGANGCYSPAPNPYTSTTSAPQTNTTPPAPLPTTYLNPQTFQIISSGIDGQYGVGGQYTPNATGEALPLDPNSNFPKGIYLPYVNTTDATIRIRERDNITNFHNGKLE